MQEVFHKHVHFIAFVTIIASLVLFFSFRRVRHRKWAFDVIHVVIPLFLTFVYSARVLVSYIGLWPSFAAVLIFAPQALVLFIISLRYILVKRKDESYSGWPISLLLWVVFGYLWTVDDFSKGRPQ